MEASPAIDAPRVVWAPLPGSQEEFLSCPLQECLLHGSRGPGKSDALLMDFAQHVGRGHGAAWRGVLFRETYPQLADIVAKSQKWFRLIFPDAEFNRGRMEWVFATGEVLMFRHMRVPDDYWAHHGQEYPWIAWDELTNWASPECYQRMFSCNRSSTPGVPRKIRSATNPYGKGTNWVKARFGLEGEWWKTQVIKDGKDSEGNIEPPRAAIHGHLRENRHLNEADPEYRRTVLAAATNKAMAAAWLNGDWNVIAGGMFDDVWSHKHNNVPKFAIPSSWRIDRAFDWGSSAPFSVGWYAESDGSDLDLADGRTISTVRGDVFRVGEWYGWSGKPNEGLRMLAVDVAKGIVERELARGWRGPDSSRVQPGPADSSIYDVENGRSIALDMENPVRVGNLMYPGVQWTRADKRPGSRKQGWEQMRAMIRAGQPTPGMVREEPGFFVVGELNPQFLRTVLSLARDDKDPDDVFDAGEDHCIAGDTLVATPDGPMRIDQMPTEGVVLTPFGWRRYENCGMKSRAEAVVDIDLEGARLTCTPDHELLGPDGWHRADAADELPSYLIKDLWTFASQPGATLLVSTSKSETARTAARAFASAGTARSVTAQGPAVAAPRRDVYCLDVPGVGAFVLANGLVVANCADEVRYRIRSSGNRVSPGHTVGMY